MTDYPRIIIQKDDLKSRAWAKAASKKNIGQLIPVSGSPIFMPFVLLKYIFLFRKPHAVVFRYLNDYSILGMTLVRTGSEFLTVFLSKLFRIKVLWICHNVDRETNSHYPKITQIRRNLLKNVSETVFVLDNLLIPYAIQELGAPREKIKDICFGRTDVFNSSRVDTYGGEKNKLVQGIENWKYFKKRKNGEAVLGLWIGSIENKKLEGLRFILDKFLNQNSFHHKEVGFIIIGPISKKLQRLDQKLYLALKSDERVYIIDDYFELLPEVWSQYADFVWKPNDDLSVNLTIYNAALAKLPLVGFSNTFLATFIDHYKLGFPIDPINFSVGEFFESVEAWNADNAALFLERKDWFNGAQNLVEAVF
ncbi:MAG: hypothetical protein ACOCQ4_00840 [bacterium]